MFEEFIDIKTIYLIVHIFGAILGAGGAFASDAMFLSTIKDGRINSDELRFMKLGSKLVWSGLAVLIISGILLFSTNPSGYLDSSKFLAKMTIIGIIIINGIIFHLIHIPHIQGHIGIRFAHSYTFMKRASFLLASGAVSMASWVLTVILGTLKAVPFSYTQIMSVYLAIITCAIFGAVIFKKIILK